MDDLKRKSIAALCKFGKFGVGKSLLLGMYEFDVPKELMRTEEDSALKQEQSLSRKYVSFKGNE